MSSVFRLNLFNLWKRLEQFKGRPISVKEISMKSGIHRNTLDPLINPGIRHEVKGVQFKTLAQLYDYFKSEGLMLSAGDFFVIEEDQARGEDKGGGNALG